MNPLMEKLHDIEGIDPVGFWPLATGLRAAIACGIVLMISLTWVFLKRLSYKKSWRSNALFQLKELEKNVSKMTANESMILLSEYLRRIGISLHSRSACAGLTGENWLKWLSAHDPKNFDWEKKGRPLVEAPYARATIQLSEERIKELICAAKRWVK